MFLKLYLIALPIYIALDLFWIGFLAKGLYQREIGFLMKENPNWPAAILFYLVFITGLVLFVLQPAVEKGSWTHALMYGALFGLVAYATYDLVNLATLKDWPIFLTVADIAWGTFVVATVSLITFFVAS